MLLAPGAYLRDEGMQPGEKRLAEQPEHRVEGNDDLLRDRSCYCGPVGPRQVQADKKIGLHLPGPVERMLQRSIAHKSIAAGA